jgi:predicted aconitase with swiveling domain
VLDLYVEPGVVLGELGDLAVAGEVDPRVADLADDDQLADDCTTEAVVLMPRCEGSTSPMLWTM